MSSPSENNSTASARPRAVVVPIVAGIGNALMAVPMVRQLKRLDGGARVRIVAQIGAMAEPFRRMSEVDEVFVTGKGAGGIARGIRWTRRQRADVYVIPFPSNRWQYNLLAAASGARRVVMHGYPIGRFGTLSFLAGATRVPARRGIHDVLQNLGLLPALGIAPDETDRPTFALSDVDRERAAELLVESKLPSERGFVAIHAGSARTILARAKRWPATKYATLAEALRAEMNDLEILLLEGPDEAGVTDEIVGHCGSTRPAVLKLKGPLREAAAVLARARLYVGSDSGLAHLAAAVGTPPVALFAPADPDRVCPFGYRDLVVAPSCGGCPSFLYPWSATRPMMASGHETCIDTIEVESVMTAVRKAMRLSTSVPARAHMAGNT